MKFFDKQGLWFVIVILLFFNCILLYKNHLSKQLNKEILIQSNISKKEIPDTYFYEESFRTGLLNDGIFLTDAILTDSLHQKIKISRLFTKGRDKVFVLRFSELHCQECVMYSIVKLLKFSETIGIDNIIFIGSYQDNRSLHILKKHLGIQGMAVYNMPQLSLPVEEQTVPYYFLLDHTLRVSNVFVPEKLVPKLTDTYFDLLINQYFKQ